MATYFGVLAALGFVLVLMGVCLRFLRRYVTGGVAGRGRVRMEVLQRVALGPKQGIALVRVGSQVLAVGVGEGGVRPLLELDGADRDALLAETPPAEVQRPQLVRSFQAALKHAIRSAALLAALCLPTALHGQAAAPASASAAPAAVAPAPAAQQPAARPAAAPPGAPLARPTAAQPVATDAPAVRVDQLDRMLPKLAPRIDLNVGKPGDGGLRLSGTVGVVIMMGLLTLLPTLLLMMTSFTRVLIVLQFLRQALGTQNAPPAQLIAALALLLTGFIMAPTLSEANRTALQPWMNGQMEEGQMLVTFVQPFRKFMLDQTRPSDLNSFMEMSHTPEVKSIDDVPLVVLTSAFVTSELKTAFQIGFAIFLPFIVIDIVVSSVLMSMGMMMLPPVMISLPFKLLLFVLVDGWTLIIQGLVGSFH
ncbi:MAG TPA: flagellar type III secretion system pore protein FliP [Longimicrobiaceae bacterium]|nr:flagellar type III secretion system pore protein FliP [Longimicrobiaceae bacterium]